jgi:ubiquitin-protein ligase
MFVRYDEDSPQYLRACICGVEGTPYSSGIFVFDIYVPPNYPQVPCMCIHVTPNANLVKANNGPGGFSPNLHRDSGKVCLSLLGTWDGPGWEPGVSNIYQVLSTIMWMILGADHPYYMEPGFGGWEGTAPSFESDPGKFI